MVKATSGTLIECEPAAKQIILGLNDQYHFIIEDLDETHVFIDTKHLDLVREKLDEILEENTYRVLEGQ